MNPTLATCATLFIIAMACWGMCDLMNRIDPWAKDIIKRIVAKVKGIYGIDTFDLFGIIFAIAATIRVYVG